MSAITVLGATGNVGRPLVTALAGTAVEVRAASRHPAASPSLPDVAPILVDLQTLQGVPAALAGADRLAVLMPAAADLPSLLDLAREAGVRRVVLMSSSLAGHDPESTIGRGGLATERIADASDLEVTVLRPTAFASNALWWAGDIRAGRPIPLPRAEELCPVVDPADVAAVACRALLEPGHGATTYTLTGPELLTPRDQVRAISAALGYDLPVEPVTAGQHADLLAQHMPRAVADALAGVHRRPAPGPEQVTPTIEQITAAVPRSFAAWVTEHIEAFAARPA